MQNLQFQITINAPKEKVWSSLFDDASYREWTAVFAPDSMAKTDWKEGSRALFVDGSDSGMISVIEKAEPNRFMSIRHIGVIKSGVEDLDSADTKQWAGAHENYTLEENSGTTQLTIDLESENMKEEFIQYFKGTWPKALEKLKEVAER